jgi:soluble lytic murein transglycosylase-like protein
LKLQKLPNLHVKNPFSVSPSIKVKINKFWLTIKILTVSLLIAALAVGAYVVNVQHQIESEKSARIALEIDTAKVEGSGIVIDATANIIKRDGNVPLELAKKYSVWIYDAAMKFNVDPVTILAIMSNESKFNYKAISPTGPIGLMQVAASWHKDKVSSSSELFDPKKNIYVGAQIISEYGKKSNTELEMLLKYNASSIAPAYAAKVIMTKRKYDAEITTAIVQNI